MKRQTSSLLELVTMLLVPAACYAFIGVFSEPSATYQIMGAAVVSSILAAILRRSHFPLLLASVLSMAGLIMFLTAQFGEGTGYYGVVPDRETYDLSRILMDEGAVQFRELRAPVPSTPAFLALSMVGAWVMAMLTDWGAMRLRLAFEPVLPAALLFAFGSILGIAGSELLATLIFAASVVAWATTQRMIRLRDNQTWLTTDLKRGPSAVARPAAAFGMAAVLGGLALGPILPGAQDGELFYWRNGGEPTRFVVTPFVKLDNRLVEQRDVDLFRVTAEEASYWRIVGLDTFEDGIWRTKKEFTDEDGRLPGDRGNAGTTVTLNQSFDIQNLADIWLPAAFAPSRINSETGVKWNAETGTLSSVQDSTDGLSYTVQSVVGLFTPEELASADTGIPSDSFGRQYLDIPDDVTPVLSTEARAITEGATSRYEQAKMLQDHFRQFDYSVSLSPRRGDPIEQFLDERIGFCQQFSGTMALMARSLGIPARVAIGFTWGDPVPGEPNTWQVTGRHTHAWPELWFGDLGWVAFEPTPGRGSPTGSDYTEIPAIQDSNSAPTLPDATTPSTTPGNTIPLDSTFDPGQFDPNLIDAGGDAVEQPFNVPWRWLAVAFIGLAYLAGLPAWRRYSRANRRAKASNNASKVGAAWLDAVEDLELGYDLVRMPSETRTEFAVRASSTYGVPKEVIHLGDLASNARFGPSSVSDLDVTAAHKAAASIAHAYRHSRPGVSRWARIVDPRRLLKSKKAHRATEEWVKAA